MKRGTWQAVGLPPSSATSATKRLCATLPGAEASCVRTIICEVCGPSFASRIAAVAAGRRVTITRATASPSDGESSLLGPAAPGEHTGEAAAAAPRLAVVLRARLATAAKSIRIRGVLVCTTFPNDDGQDFTRGHVANDLDKRTTAANRYSTRTASGRPEPDSDLQRTGLNRGKNAHVVARLSLGVMLVWAC